jgi:hypothetical protein
MCIYIYMYICIYKENNQRNMYTHPQYYWVLASFTLEDHPKHFLTEILCCPGVKSHIQI